MKPTTSDEEMSPEFTEYLKLKAESGEFEQFSEMPSVQTKAIREKLIKNIDMNTTHDINDAQPGVVVTPVKVSDDTTPDYSQYKDKANKALISAVAQEKLKKQREAERQRPMEARVRDYYITASLHNISTNYLEKHGFCMTGKQLRTIRKKLERNYGKPGYTPSPKDKLKIIDYLNMPSNDERNNQTNPYKTERSTAQNVASLLNI